MCSEWSIQFYSRFYSNLLKVAREDFSVTIPFNLKRLDQNLYQSNKKSNVTGVLEKDESFK